VPEQQLSKRAAAQRRIAEKRAAEARARAQAERRRRTIIGGVVAAVVVVVALIVVVAVQSQRTTVSSQALTPAHTVSNGEVIEVGQAGAKTTVDLYFDYQCPNCKSFEDQNGATIDQQLASGAIKVRYHGMAFLDNSTNNRYSTRALNAAAAVVNSAGTDAFQKFHDLLYANQPPESGTGLSDNQLISFAAQAGASGSTVQQQIKNLAFGDWVKKVTDQASKDGVTGTPTVKVNGQQVQDWSKTGFDAALSAAQGG
jgi:protein-disulfide isomerase